MNNAETFAQRLNRLRKERNLTVEKLARMALVPKSLISGLQTNTRKIAEYQARKIGVALTLHESDLEDFIFSAINNSSSKVLNSSKAYPAEVLNLIAGELQALGILPNSITRCVRKQQDADAALYLNDGMTALINVEVAMV